MEKLMTVEEAAEVLRAHRKTVYGWIEKGLLRAIKLPTGSLRVTEEAIDEFVKKGGEACPEGSETTETT